jgi:hypothetical protein
MSRKVTNTVFAIAVYAYKAEFNRPDKRVLDKLGKKPVRIPEPKQETNPKRDSG